MDAHSGWTHDLDLPQYGPYNKRYVGFSHIADPERGLRLDIDVLPGFYRRSVMDTRAIADGGARMLSARPDLLGFAFRYDMIPGGRLYCDARLAQEGAAAQLKLTFVNNTRRPESVMADLCFSLRGQTYYHRAVRGAEISLPEGVLWIDAADYARQEGFSGIAADGFRLGERFEDGAVKGAALDTGKDGQTVSLIYRFAPVRADRLLLRCRAEPGATVTVCGKAHALPACEALTVLELPLEPGEYSELILDFSGGQTVIDGFAIGPGAQDSAFSPWPKAFAPEIEEGQGEMTLRYPLLKKPYTVRWDAPDYVVRQLEGESDGEILTRSIHNHVSRTLKGGGDGHFADLFIRPLFIPPRGSVCVNVQIAFGKAPRPVEAPIAPLLAGNPAGGPLSPSMERLAATTAMNVVYPMYFRGRFIKSYSPGRNWDSFYTWDLGMNAVGLLTLDRGLGAQLIRAYLMPEGDPHSPYLNHGTPILTQMFGFKALLDAGDYDACRALYPSLRGAYRFFAALPRRGGLPVAWHIFYNSGGWDDYPAQKYTHDHGLAPKTAPVIQASMLLLYGVILKNAARLLGFEADAVQYDALRQPLIRALEACWDEETGYYGYARDDGAGGFAGILRDERGNNMNQGLDGLYPALVGAVEPDRAKRMLKNLREGLMTRYGVSVVDTRAPYFSLSGYWNGSVWVPHQWILWKALLDLGETRLAHRIAMTAMRLWRRETDVDGNCYEHFMLANGRGAGFHHFSGLSAPMLAFYQSYYTPGTATVGFDTSILSQRWNGEKTALDITVETHRDGSALLATLRQGPDYHFEGLSEGSSVRQVHPGTYCLRWKRPGKYSVSIRAGAPAE
ncbi:MAG: hypothetical protein IKO07_09925 [Clostridia bacterium]|nr:hypothetical protein [Clostridia bacterium]